jgi:hypothetical protein
MIVKLTHAVQTESGRLEAGQIVDVDTETAADWIAHDWAFEFIKDVVEVTELADSLPIFIEATKKKVKHG